MRRRNWKLKKLKLNPVDTSETTEGWSGIDVLWQDFRVRRENANGYIVYTSCVRKARKKLQCMEVSRNEQPGMPPSCQDKKEGLGCWLCCTVVIIPRDCHLKASPWEVHYFPCQYCSLSFYTRKKRPPGLKRPGWVIIVSFLFQAYHLSKGFCFSALWGNELSGEKGHRYCENYFSGVV